MLVSAGKEGGEVAGLKVATAGGGASPFTVAGRTDGNPGIGDVECETEGSWC